MRKPYTLEEAAELLRKSPRVVREMAGRGAIAPAYKVGRDWIFPRAAKVLDGRGTFFTLGDLEAVK